MEALSYDEALRAYIKGEKLEGDDMAQAKELLELLPDDVRSNVDAGRRDILRGRKR